MMIPTEECIYAPLVIEEGLTAIRFLDSITLERIGKPDLILNSEIKYFCKVNAQYIVAGDENGTLSFVSCLTNKVESVFSIKELAEDDITINEIKLLPGRLLKCGEENQFLLAVTYFK
jgi:hypothetical protein